MFSVKLRDLILVANVIFAALLPLGALAGPTEDCARYLTESQILARHIDESPAELQKLFAHYEEQVRNWRAFLNGTPISDFNIHTLHQTQIKELNEKILHLSGSEEYLETFHDLLHTFLKTNPAFGVVLHNDYKNHFVASSLEEVAFRELVLTPVMKRLVEHMQIKFPDWDWAKWVPATIYHGQGKTPAEAYFRVGMARAKFIPNALGMSVREWQAQAISRRARLVKFAAEKSIDWAELLLMIHKSIGRGLVEEAELNEWLKKNGGDSALLAELGYYYDDLQIADFHPLPESSVIPESFDAFVSGRHDATKAAQHANWTVERRMIFTMAKDARYVLVTDVKSLGAIGRKFQDQWIARGARLEELQSVYAQSTAALEGFFAKVHAQLNGIMAGSGEVRVYLSGDDAIWFFPEMTIPKRAKVKWLFRWLGETGGIEDSISLRLHHSNAMKIDPKLTLSQGIAEALTRARVSLFVGKKKTVSVK